MMELDAVCVAELEPDRVTELDAVPVLEAEGV